MRAIHWIRSRQESREISYWLSFVFFDTKDRSLSNRIYLVYLVAFFTVWWFMVLIWFAEAGAFLLTTFSPADPVALAVSLALIVFLVWFAISFYQAIRRSPVAFSEEDALLTCQMPLNPRMIVVRWLAMPWVKSLLPFILLALVLGFSAAEIALVPGAPMGQQLLEYARTGLRAVLMVIPLHMTVYAFNWSVGIGFMSRRRRLQAAWLPATFFLLVVLALLSGIAAYFAAEPATIVQILSMVTAFPLRVGLGSGDIATPLLVGGAVGAFSLVVLSLAAKDFSPSLAAQETKLQSSIRDMQRYGFSGQAKEIRDQKRLGWERRTAWLPAWTGAGGMVWKDILQFFRTLNLGVAFNLLFFISSFMGLAYLPSLSGRIFLILTWVLQAGQFLTHRLHGDLTHWATVTQLPIKPKKWIVYDLLLASGLVLLMGMIGLGGGSLLMGRIATRELLALPGMVVSVAGISAADIFKNSKISLLLNGQAPGVSELGVVFGTICAGIPVLAYSLIPGSAGALIGLFASLVIAAFAISNAVNTYHVIR